MREYNNAMNLYEQKILFKKNTAKFYVNLIRLHASTST